MKSILYSIMLMSMMAMTNAYSQTPKLTFRFNNASISADTLITDIEVKADIAGSFLSDIALYFNYNTAAFGASAVANNAIIVLPLDAVSGNFSGNPKYSLNVTDNGNARVAIIGTSNLGSLPPDTQFHNEVPTTFTKVARVKLLIDNVGQLAGIDFETSLMNGESYYLLGANNPVRYANPSDYNNDLLNFPLSNTTTCPTLSIGAAIQDETCNGSDGSIALTASSGTAPYTYNWSNGATTASITGLATGTYTVTVTDANNCDTLLSYTVNAIPLPTTTAISGSASVNTGSTMTYSVTNTTGHTYNWSATNGTIQSGQGTNEIRVQWNNAGSGTLSVIETDGNGCAGAAVNLNVTITTSIVNMPTNLTVTPAYALGFYSMHLDWINQSNIATHIRIRINGGQEIPIPLDSTWNDFSGITPNTQFCYEIRAEQQDGNGTILATSAYTSQVCATALPTLPTVPVAISATAISTSAIDVVWQNDLTAVIDSFVIRRSNGGVFQVIAAISNPATTTVTFNDTGLQPNTTYIYQIAAKNVLGTSNYGNSVQATTFSVILPPINLTGTSITPMHVTLNWTNPATKVYRTEVGVANSTVVFNNSGNLESYIDNDFGLKEDTNYEYKVENDNGDFDIDTVYIGSGCEYDFEDGALDCSATSFGLVIKKTGVINNVNGFKFSFVYNTNNYNYVNIGVNPTLIAPANLQPPITRVNGDTVTILLSANNGVTTFQGSDSLAIVHFNLANTSHVPSGDIFELLYVEENYVNGPIVHCAEDGSLTQDSNDSSTFQIQYMNGQPMTNSTNPLAATLTLQGSDDADCATLSPDTFEPNGAGIITYPTSNGLYLKFDKNIQGDYYNPPSLAVENQVKQVITAYDAFLLVQILNGGNYTIADLLRADVNKDGFVNSADLTYILNRSVGAIHEFPQMGVYTNASIPISASHISEDFLFIDSTTLATLTGDLSNVPNEGNCRSIPTLGTPQCPIYPTTTWYGMMYGDISGNLNSSHDLLRTVKDHIIFDLEMACTPTTEVIIPVSLEKGTPSSTMNALGWTLDYDETKYTFDTLYAATALTNEPLPVFNNDDGVLSFSAYSTTPYSENVPLFYVVFDATTSGQMIDALDFRCTNSHINEKEVIVEFPNDCIVDTKPVNFDFSLMVYPNPSVNDVTIQFESNTLATIDLRIYNVLGQQLTLQRLTESITPIDLSDYPKGTYFFEFASEGQRLKVERVVKQ